MENYEKRSNKCQQRTKNTTNTLTKLSISACKFQSENSVISATKLNVKSGKSIVRPQKCGMLSIHGITFLSVLFNIMIINLFNICYYASAYAIDSGFSDQRFKRWEKNFTNPAQALPTYRTHISEERRHEPQLNEDTLKIVGIRGEDGTFDIEDGVMTVMSERNQLIRVFGVGLKNISVIAFTVVSNKEKGSCLKPDTELFHSKHTSENGLTATFLVRFPIGTNVYYLCAKNDENKEGIIATDTKPLIHQGDSSSLKILTTQPLLPNWAAILVIIICLCFSALFSGLNLGLMALDRTELKILRNTGTKKERDYAARIQPVRDQGNYLLCSILLGNVLVNSTFTILLDGLTSGLIAVVFSTIAIVLFGEITPQAICSRHGLAVGAKTIYITKTIMAITAPLSYPVSKVLDLILGEEIGNVYNRERLKELVRVTTGINDLDKNEVNIISGALELRKKTVGDIMTHIEDAFMLSLDAILDFETVSEIMKSGYSRIPVYDTDRKNIITLLYIKDLAFVDTDDNTPLKTLCEFYQNPVHFVFEDYTLDVMFNQFKEGSMGHLAFVHRVNNEGDGDPFYETVGLVTLEDVIEELIQAEIVDEFDVFVDNRTKVKRNRRKQDFSAFAERRENQVVRVSPQLTLATYQYLSTAVDAFKNDVISEQILRRLLNQDIFHIIKPKGKDKSDPSLYIFTQGKPVDFFVLILEGRVEVTIGREALLFESGPFTYFGTQALMPNVVIDSPTQKGSMQSLNIDTKIRQTFVPDYSVRSLTDVVYIAIKRNLYLTAKKATLLEKSRKSGSYSTEAFDDEVERLLHSIADDEKPCNLAENLRNPVKSGTSSPENNDISKHDNSATISGQNTQNPKADTENASISSLITSEIATDLQNGERYEREDNAVSPLLPKANDKIEHNTQ